ncbi:GrdX protein [Escherichia coli TA206]|uniref:GrdX family protein n=1 Tax=Escherichia coli TaxID=562 RepID=UPI0001E8A75C|nr:GrdX family protein [Escherichia coli]EGI25789.1 GrdX protein [Escherichia coli TA206]
METLLIITNNPAVQARYRGCMLSMQPDYQRVLLTARDAIHQGWRLMMHPESGSVLPGRTPYRSLLLDNTHRRPDWTSLEMIENALIRFRHFQPPELVSHWPAGVLRDFQFIDLNLLRQAVENCAGNSLMT